MPVLRGADLRVADVVREHAVGASDDRRREAGRPRAHLRDARRAFEPARPGLARERGGPGSRIAYLDRAAPEIVELVFAASKIGAVAVPLNWRLAGARAPAGARGRARADPHRRAGVRGDRRQRCRARSPRRRGSSRVGDGVRGVARSLRGGRPGWKRRGRRCRAPALHVGDDRRAEGRPHDPPQPGGCAETSPYWQFDAETVSATPLPMFHIGGIGWTFLGLWNGATTILVREFVPEAVLDLLEHERVTNGIFVPTMLQMLTAVPGADRARLLGPALDRLRRLADHDAGAERGAAHVPLLALRGLRPHRDDGRRRAARSGGPRPGGPREHLLLSAGRPLPWVELRIADPETGSSCRRARSARCGCGRRT